MKLAVRFVSGLELFRVVDGLWPWLLQHAISHTLFTAACATVLGGEKDL